MKKTRLSIRIVACAIASSLLTQGVEGAAWSAHLSASIPYSQESLFHNQALSETGVAQIDSITDADNTAREVAAALVAHHFHETPATLPESVPSLDESNQNKVAIVGDTHFTRQVLLALIKQGVQVSIWAAETDPEGRVSFLNSTTHAKLAAEDIEFIGDPGSEFQLNIAGQESPIEMLVFRPGAKGALSNSSHALTEALRGQIGTVIADRMGLVDEKALLEAGTRVVVADQAPGADERIAQIVAMPRQAAHHIGEAIRELASGLGANVQFAQLQVIEPNEGALQPRYGSPGSAQMTMKLSGEYQTELREGLGIDEDRVPETMQIGFPIRQGLIMTAVLALDKPVSGYEIEKHFRTLAQRDGNFVIPDSRELINTERIPGPGLYLYGDPIVQVSEDGRSLIQISFIADPTQTRVAQAVAAPAGQTFRVENPIQEYRETPADLTVSPIKRRLADAIKSDLAQVVNVMASRFGLKWADLLVKKRLRQNPQDRSLLAKFLNIESDHILNVKTLRDAQYGIVGLEVELKSRELIGVPLVPTHEPEAVPAYLGAYYHHLRSSLLGRQAAAGKPIQIIDYYQTVNKLATVWEMNGHETAVLQRVVKMGQNGQFETLQTFNVPYHPQGENEIGVFVNGAGGRTGNTTARVLAGDAVDAVRHSVDPVSDKTSLICVGLSGGANVSGAEALASLWNSDTLVGPYAGSVHHGHESGRHEDWVEVAPADGRWTRKFAVFSHRLFRDPENYPLGSFQLAGVKLAAFEGARTPNFASVAGLNRYLLAGAQQAVVPNPGSSKDDPHWNTHTFVNRMNGDAYHPAKRQISLASCTTSVAAATNLLLGMVGARKLAGRLLPAHLLREYQAPGGAVGNTLHGYTQETRGLDGSHDPSEKSQGRLVTDGDAGYGGPTGYSTALGYAGSPIIGKGVAHRGPWGAGSILDQVADVPGHWTLDEIREVYHSLDPDTIGFTLAGEGEEMRAIYQLTRMFSRFAAHHAVIDLSLFQIVHFTDNRGNPRSYVFVPSGYENEWGYSSGAARFYDETMRPAQQVDADIPMHKYPLRLSASPEEGQVLYSDRVYMPDFSDEELAQKFGGKVVFVRADYNVVEPEMTEVSPGQFEVKPKIIEEFRILATHPDLWRLQKAGARIVLASHNGRFKDVVKDRAGNSLEPVAQELQKVFGADRVKFSPETIGDGVKQAVSNLKDGDILFLENLRGNPGEEGGDVRFAEALADSINPDAYFFLAFGAAHRGKHGSIGPLIETLRLRNPGIPVIGGAIIKKELDGQKAFLNDPEAGESGVAILGGAKISDKIEVMRGLILNHRVKKIIPVGAMSFYFSLAQGKSVGNSFLENDAEDVERSVQAAYDILNLAQAEGIEIVLPIGYRGTFGSVDKRLASGLDASRVHTAKIGETGLPERFYGYTIDEESVEIIRSAIKGAKWIVLNGTAGMVEVDEFRKENDAIIEAIDAQVKGGTSKALLLGGDGVAAFSKWARAAYGENYLDLLPEGYTLSTGGGASLELFARMVLSGLDPLDIQISPKTNGEKLTVHGNLKWRIATRKALHDHLGQLVEALKGVDPDTVNAVIYVPSNLANDPELFKIIAGSPIQLGVQSIKLADGPVNEITQVELTTAEAAHMGYRYVMIGHSDRRKGTLTSEGILSGELKPESEERINARLLETLTQPELTPLFLFGENESGRLREIFHVDRPFAMIDRQLEAGLRHVPADQVRRIHFGYEPSWAIGRQAAEPLYAEVRLRHIRERLGSKYSPEVARACVIGYGAGTNEKNIISYLSREGQLVVPGRPSVVPYSFAAMVMQAVAFARRLVGLQQTAITSQDLVSNSGRDVIERNLLPRGPGTVLSIGISAAGHDEIAFAKHNSDLKIIGTTIDAAGVEISREHIQAAGLGDKIEVKNEDATKPFPYPDHSIDFVYARLVLHYLSAQEFDFAMAEIQRVLKPGGKVYVVVKSDHDYWATHGEPTFDLQTELTEYLDHELTPAKRLRRQFISEQRLRKYAEEAGFKIDTVSESQEVLYKDFARTIPTSTPRTYLTLVASKPFSTATGSSGDEERIEDALDASPPITARQEIAGTHHHGILSSRPLSRTMLLAVVATLSLLYVLPQSFASLVITLFLLGLTWLAHHHMSRLNADNAQTWAAA